MLHHAIAFIEGLNSVVMIYITLVAQLDGGPRECHNQMNQMNQPIILDDRLALPSECFVSMTSFSFGLLLCIIFEESLLNLPSPPHHVDPYQFHIQSLLNSVITFSIRRSASSNHSLSIQILSFFFFFNLKACYLYLNSVRLIFRCHIYQENMMQNLLDCKSSEL